jgi:hypothetical protein
MGAVKKLSVVAFAIRERRHPVATTTMPGPQQRASLPLALTTAALIFAVLPIAIALMLLTVASLSPQWGLYPWLDFIWIGSGGVFPLLGIALSVAALTGYRRTHEKGGRRSQAIVALVVSALEAVPLGAAAIYLIAIGGWNFLI